MNKSLLILGAGGHGRSIAELAILDGSFLRIAFLDDSWQPENTDATKILGRMVDLEKHKISFTHTVIAIGNNLVREKLHEKVLAEGLTLATLVHPMACISPSARLGEGSVILAGAVIGCNTHLGKGVIINCNSTVDHDGFIDDFAHLGVGVHLAGGCHIGKGAFLQAGSCGGFKASVEPHTVYAPGSTLKSRV